MKTTKILIALAALIIVVGLGWCISSQIARAPAAAAPQAKLNINAVCDNALTYMKFADAASMDAFVADCKEGKHPEVIERYKAQMNLGDGALI